METIMMQMCQYVALCAILAADPSALSDEFEDAAALKQWQRVHEVEQTRADQLAQFDVKDGRMILVPHASVWYRDWRGALVFKPVSGDFVVTAKLKVTGRSGEGAPRSLFSLAGLMIRGPRSVTPQTWREGGENYCFLSLGSADKPGQYQFEVKTTRNSDSLLQIAEAPGPEAELRLARVGGVIIAARRPAGGAWVIHQRYRRGDLPGEVQVGLTCYTDWPTCERVPPAQHNVTVIREGNPDLRAEVDWVRFSGVKLPAGLEGKDLADAAVVSDEEILGWLGS